MLVFNSAHTTPAIVAAAVADANPDTPITLEGCGRPAETCPRGSTIRIGLRMCSKWMPMRMASAVTPPPMRFGISSRRSRGRWRSGSCAGSNRFGPGGRLLRCAGDLALQLLDERGESLVNPEHPAAHSLVEVTDQAEVLTAGGQARIYFLPFGVENREVCAGAGFA